MVKPTPTLLACVFFPLTLLACGSDSPIVEEIPDATPVQLETFSVSLGPDRAGTNVFSSKSTGELITGVVADEEGNASLSGQPGGMVSFTRRGGDIVSFLGIRTGEVLMWQNEEFVPLSEHTLSIVHQVVHGAEDYIGYTCSYRALAQDPKLPQKMDFVFSEECLSQATVSFSAFAYDSDFVLAYAQLEAPSTAIPDEVLTFEWKTDFVETPIEFASIVGPTMNARNTLRYGGHNVTMPSHKLVVGAPVLFTPPDTELAWTELTRFPPGQGWHSVKGALPTQTSDWPALTQVISVTHTNEQGLSMTWLPTKEGEFQRGDYTWEDSAGYHNWTFVAPNSVGLAIYPETPTGMKPAEPNFAFMNLSVDDYDDQEGYAMALATNRAAWEYGPPDSFFENGGMFSSSTLFSFSSPAKRELNEVLDHLAPYYTHLRLAAPFANASNADNGTAVR